MFLFDINYDTIVLWHLLFVRDSFLKSIYCNNNG